MSRVGTLPINRKGVQVDFKDSVLTFSGPMGVNKLHIPNDFLLNINDDFITIEPVDKENMELRKLWGTLNRLINNSCSGTLKLFEKPLKLVGLGYKVVKEVSKEGDELLRFDLSYSHPVYVKIPEGIIIKSPNPITLTVTGIDKQKVGEFANRLTTLRKYNPYNGKGILLMDGSRHYRKKEVKK